jgi:hypothetical protein
MERRLYGDEFRNLSVSKWPAAESDSKPGKLSAAKFAEFASDGFVALYWRAVRGQLRSVRMLNCLSITGRSAAFQICCGASTIGTVKIITTIKDSAMIARLPEHLWFSSQPLPRAPVRRVILS